MGVYGHPEDQQKCETWYLMCHLNNQASLPWVYVGDFNEILSSIEKNGELSKPLSMMQAFQSTLLHCGLVDLGYQGKIFMWRNGRRGNDFVKERLDRACANNEWSSIFPRAKVSHLDVSYFDHDLIQLSLGT